MRGAQSISFGGAWWHANTLNTSRHIHKCHMSLRALVWFSFSWSCSCNWQRKWEFGGLALASLEMLSSPRTEELEEGLWPSPCHRWKKWDPKTLQFDHVCTGLMRIWGPGFFPLAPTRRSGMGRGGVGAQERCGHLAPTAGLVRVNLALGGTTGSAPASFTPFEAVACGRGFPLAQQLCPAFGFGDEGEFPGLWPQGLRSHC